MRQVIKVMLRRLLRNRTASLINIGGLAFALSVCILIGLWISYEMNYDRVHGNIETIAKLRQNVRVNNTVITDKVVPLPLADELSTNYKPYFKHVVRSSHRMAHLVSYGDKTFNQHGVYIDPDAPALFGLNMLSGSSDGLEELHSVLLSASAAKAYFGSDDPVNKVLSIDKNVEVKVTGVFEDLPFNSTFASVKFIAPFLLYLKQEQWLAPLAHNWSKSPVQLYVQINDHYKMDQVSGLIKNIIRQKNNDVEQAGHQELFLEPMNQWHLYADYSNGVVDGGKIRYVRMFAIVGLFILILACINFMNLATASSRKMAMEVGVRKAIGSLRHQLVTRFYVESFITVLLSFVLAIVMVVVILPAFNEEMKTKLAIPWTGVFFWISCSIVILVTGLLAGSYPALYLSSFNAIKVLKGDYEAGSSTTVPRKVLVVFQFSVCICLLFATVMIASQIKFGKNRPVGYEPEKLIQVHLPARDFSEHLPAFQDELLKTPFVESVAMSESTATDVWGTDNALEWKNKDPELVIDFPNTGVSANYGKTVQWEFIAGRDFSEEYASDSSAFILNEAAAKFMGLTNPVGETIRWNSRLFTVIGVIRNVIVESPFKPVRPALYCMARGSDNYLFVRIKESADNVTATNAIGTVFKKFTSSQPFDFRFVEDEYDNKFSAETQVNNLATLFSILAVIISALGLFGLTSFIAEQRRKELGLRKILGATSVNVWRLLTKEFVVLVLISFVIAAPISFLYVSNWLQQFEYHIAVDWLLFLLICSGCLVVTVVTVSFKAIKTALANPIDSLRSE